MTQKSTYNHKLLSIQELLSAPIISSYLEAVLVWLKLCTTEPGPHLSYRNGTPDISYPQVLDPHNSTFPVGKKEFLHSCEDVSVFSVEKRTFWNRTRKCPVSLRSFSCSHTVAPVLSTCSVMLMALYCMHNFRHE